MQYLTEVVIPPVQNTVKIYRNIVIVHYEFGSWLVNLF